MNPRSGPDAPRRRRAEELGVSIEYVDSQGRGARSTDAAVDAVCDLLQGATRLGAAAPVDEVIVVRAGHLPTGIDALPAGGVRVSVTLEDGSTLAPDHEMTADAPFPVPLASLPLGVHHVDWVSPTESGTSTLLVAPGRFTVPDRDRPGLALFAPAYALWTEHEPRPSYDGLAALGTSMAPLGVDAVATLPLYAPGLGARFESSPYSPISRFHWNELLVPSRLSGGATPHAPSGEDRIDWADVHDVRARQLHEFVAGCTDRCLEELTAFLHDRPDVTSYAAYVAGDDPGAQQRLEAGQWLAERALQETCAAMRSAGSALALDLPVGARHESWETATWPHLFVRAASIGAPPDTFFAAGQDWALPPLDPVASRRDGHRVWASLLRTACRFADVLRIDHVMQLFRLWWIPEGHDADDGAYVRYPANELIAVAAIVAAQTGTTMVGENLGTVPDEVTALLTDWGLPGMYEEGFTLHDWHDRSVTGPPHRLPEVPARSWSGIRTHDMPPLAVTLDELRLDAYRTELGRLLGEKSAIDHDALHRAMLSRLRRSGAMEIVVDADDLLGVRVPHNVPGTRSAANWSRRLAVPADHLGDDPRVQDLLGDSAP